MNSAFLRKSLNQFLSKADSFQSESDPLHALRCSFGYPLMPLYRRKGRQRSRHIRHARARLTTVQSRIWRDRRPHEKLPGNATGTPLISVSYRAVKTVKKRRISETGLSWPVFEEPRISPRTFYGRHVNGFRGAIARIGARLRVRRVSAERCRRIKLPRQS